MKPCETMTNFHTRTAWMDTARWSRIDRAMLTGSKTITRAIKNKMLLTRHSMIMEGRLIMITATTMLVKCLRELLATMVVSTTSNTATTTITRTKTPEILSLIIMSPQLKTNNTCSNSGAIHNPISRRKWILESRLSIEMIRMIGITTMKMMKRTD